jgi:hypothetical protein
MPLSATLRRFHVETLYERSYVAFALSPITRPERADASRPFITAQYDPKLQAFLGFVLSQYVQEGVGELDQAKLPHLLELKYRAVSDAALDAGEAIPAPSSLEALRQKPDYAGWMFGIITLDAALLDDTIERVNITLPRRVLRRLDALARAAGESRSGYIAHLTLEMPPARLPP